MYANNYFINKTIRKLCADSLLLIYSFGKIETLESGEIFAP